MLYETAMIALDISVNASLARILFLLTFLISMKTLPFKQKKAGKG